MYWRRLAQWLRRPQGHGALRPETSSPDSPCPPARIHMTYRRLFGGNSATPRWPGRQAVTPRISSGSHPHMGTCAHSLRVCCCSLRSPGGGGCGHDLITPVRGCSWWSNSTSWSPLLVANLTVTLHAKPSLHYTTTWSAFSTILAPVVPWPRGCFRRALLSHCHFLVWCHLSGVLFVLATFSARFEYAFCTTYTGKSCRAVHLSFYCATASLRARQITSTRAVCVPTTVFTDRLEKKVMIGNTYPGSETKTGTVEAERDTWN